MIRLTLSLLTAVILQGTLLSAPIRYGYPPTLHGEIALALEKSGIAKENGLDVQGTFFQYGPPQIEALASKSLDIAFTSIIPTANFVAKQPDAVEVIAVLGNSSHGLLVPADSPIKSLADFRGKKIAVAFGSDSYVDLLSSLKAVGIEFPKDVTLVNVPPNEQPDALEQKLADGVLLRQPQLRKFTEKGYREINHWPHHLVVIARTEWLKENPDAKTRFLTALRESVVYVAKNSKQSAEWFGEKTRLDPEQIALTALENPIYIGATEPSKVNLKATPEFRAFVAKRSQELVDFGLSKNIGNVTFAE